MEAGHHRGEGIIPIPALASAGPMSTGHKYGGDPKHWLKQVSEQRKQDPVECSVSIASDVASQEI